MLMINKEKMSKSLNNFFTIRDILNKYDCESVRYFFLTAQYRSLLDYSEENIGLARSALERLYTALRGCDVNVELNEDDSYVQAFKEAMNDDFNTPGALAVLFELARENNKAKGENQAQANQLASRLKQLAGVLGLLEQDPETFLQGEANNDEVAEIEALIAQRNEAKANKNWAVADEVRDKLKAMNIVLEDTPNGTTWRKA